MPSCKVGASAPAWTVHGAPARASLALRRALVTPQQVGPGWVWRTCALRRAFWRPLAHGRIAAKRDLVWLSASPGFGNLYCGIDSDARQTQDDGSLRNLTGLCPSILTTTTSARSWEGCARWTSCCCMVAAAVCSPPVTSSSAHHFSTTAYHHLHLFYPNLHPPSVQRPRLAPNHRSQTAKTPRSCCP